jgi:hypothetical protein
MTGINKVGIEAGALLSSLKKTKVQKKRSLSEINDLVEEVHAVDPGGKTAAGERISLTYREF